MDENRKLYSALKAFFFSKEDLNVFRFVAVGLMNTAFGYSVFALFYFLSKDFGVSIVNAYLLGFLFNLGSAKLFLLPHSKSRILYLFAVYGSFGLINYFLLLELSNYHNIYLLQIFIQIILAGILYLILKFLEKLSHD